jgi:hypothetical protein
MTSVVCITKDFLDLKNKDVFYIFDEFPGITQKLHYFEKEKIKRLLKM